MGGKRRLTRYKMKIYEKCPKKLVDMAIIGSNDNEGKRVHYPALDIHVGNRGLTWRWNQ